MAAHLRRHRRQAMLLFLSGSFDAKSKTPEVCGIKITIHAGTRGMLGRPRCRLTCGAANKLGLKRTPLLRAISSNSWLCMVNPNWYQSNLLFLLHLRCNDLSKLWPRRFSLHALHPFRFLSDNDCVCHCTYRLRRRSARNRERFYE